VHAFVNILCGISSVCSLFCLVFNIPLVLFMSVSWANIKLDIREIQCKLDSSGSDSI
jgi:hypothetical protein